MRFQRSVQLLIVLTTLAALGACASYGREQQSDPQVTTVTAESWDSGPLDRDYARERTSMDNRHQQEIANPRADESSDQRAQRHTAENADLQHRYESGKVHHTQTLPASDRKDHDEKPNEQPHQ